MPRRSSPNSDVLKRSVTKQDYNQNPQDGYGGIYQLTLPYQSGTTGDLPAYWSPMRDRVLKTTPMRESMWASAIGIATSKVASSDWRLDGRKVQYWQNLLLAADNNQSWIAFQEKQVRDHILTDNGNFFEIIRVSNARGARIIGVQHLSSWRSIRTGDPDVPVIYRDRRGTWHEMKDYQVVAMADEPDSDDIYFGVGHCAASRAWNAINKLSALELYVYEKVSGKRPSRIYLVNANLSEKQLLSAIEAGTERSNEKGYVMYMDAIMVPILDPSASASVATIDLKGLPEGFDAEKERREAKLTYADAIGLDPLEIDPELATRGKSLGTGAQAQVLDDKQAGRGIISYKKKAQYLYNEFILPDRVTFFFAESDLVDSGRRADITKLRIDAMRAAVGNGKDFPILTPEQAKQWLADVGEISPEFLIQDLTSQETIRDTEKPDAVLDLEHEPPLDAALMKTKPDPIALPSTNGNGNKPRPAQKSMNQHLAEKAHDELLNRAYTWASGRLPNYFMLAEDELLELYQEQLDSRYPQPKEVVTYKEIVKELPKPEPTVVVVQSPPAPANDNSFLEKAMDFLRLQSLQPKEKETAPQPIINISIPPIEIPQPQITINPMPVTVQAPDVKVEVAAPIVHVAAPNVTIENQAPQAPQVTVQVPEQPTPQITVNVPQPSSEVMDIERDAEGLITRVVKQITNTEV